MGRQLIHLAHITRNANMKYKELKTLIIQIEAILNSLVCSLLFHRVPPTILFHLLRDTFLIGTLLTFYPEPSLDEISVNRLSR